LPVVSFGCKDTGQMGQARTIDDDGFTDRVYRIVNRMIYGFPPESEEDPYEQTAARLMIRWQIEETIEESTNTTVSKPL